jgi:hypothetical protein
MCWVAKGRSAKDRAGTGRARMGQVGTGRAKMGRLETGRSGTGRSRKKVAADLPPFNWFLSLFYQAQAIRHRGSEEDQH